MFENGDLIKVERKSLDLVKEDRD